MGEDSKAVVSSRQYTSLRGESQESDSCSKSADVPYSLAVAVEVALSEAFHELFGAVFVDGFEMDLSSLDTFAISMHFRSPIAYSEIPHATVFTAPFDKYDEATALIKRLGGIALAGFFSTINIDETCVGADDAGHITCMFSAQAARCLHI